VAALLSRASGRAGQGRAGQGTTAYACMVKQGDICGQGQGQAQGQGQKQRVEEACKHRTKGQNRI